MNHNAEPTIACLTDPAAEQMLVVAAKNGDEQAFETLFKRHRQKILRVVLRYAHVREDAEDIVQQRRKTLSSKASKRLSSICTSLKGNPPSPPG